jgi:catechol 2,3-dioxygenase-like lactoylglutathione lyase family enzyme
MEVLAGRAPFQIAFVVTDLEAAARRFDALVGAGPWRGYVFDEPDWALRLALNDSHPQYELVQPLRGDSAHSRWLDEGRTGMHHVGYVVESIDAVATELETAGHPVVMEAKGFGADGDGRGVYVDTVAALGFYVELVEPPAAMPAADFTL